MNIFQLKSFNNQPISFGNIDKRNINNGVSISPLLDLERTPNKDTIHITSPSFTSSNRTSNSTKRGRFLKRLHNITDPYSGTKILTKEEFEEYKNTIPQIENTFLRVSRLYKYTSNMRPVERDIFQKLDNKIRKFEKEKKEKGLNDINLTFSEILKSEKNTALKRLEIKEYDILNQVIEETKTMKPHNAKKVLDLVNTTWRTVNNDEHHFKRKDFIQSLLDMREEQQDNPHFIKLVAIAHKLPNSHIDTDAFIVKYADRSEEEITNRLVSSSVGTIEHIIPDTNGGIDEASNFLLTTAGGNVERDIMKYSDYIKLHPKIPRYTQEYMNDIIDAGNRGELKDYEWYPYVVAPTIEKEMGIKIDLSKYKIKPKKAFKTFPERLTELYPQFSSYYNKK